MTAATLTLTEFLLARIAEDEAFWPFAVDEVEFIGPGMVDARERARRDCEAKRLLLEWLGAGGLTADAGYAVRVLATPYADHPDYRDEWLP